MTKTTRPSSSFLISNVASMRRFGSYTCSYLIASGLAPQTGALKVLESLFFVTCRCCLRLFAWVREPPVALLHLEVYLGT